MNGWAAAPQPPDSSAPVENGELIVVEGMAGTGKTVLLSHLFLRIMNELVVPVAGDGSGGKITERPVNACLLINHEEQLTVYNAIMKRLGLQNKDGVVVDKPTRFINKHSESGHGNGLARQDYPCDPVDVALVDEAYLLLTQGNQGYSGSRNMLVDIMRRARVVIAVYDLGQVLRKSQELDASMRDALFPEKRFSDGKVRCARRAANVAGFPFHVENLLLRQQYRIDACDEVVRWIDDFANGRGVGPIPQDPAREGHTPYQIKVFDSTYDLKMAIEERAFAFDASSGEIVDDTSHGLSRVLATYDWPYSGQSKPESGVWEVRIYREQGGWVSYGASGARGGRGSRHAQAAASIAEVPRTQYFHMPWNYQTSATGDAAAREHDKAWAEQPHTLGECGSSLYHPGVRPQLRGRDHWALSLLARRTAGVRPVKELQLAGDQRQRGPGGRTFGTSSTCCSSEVCTGSTCLRLTVRSSIACWRCRRPARRNETKGQSLCLIGGCGSYLSQPSSQLSRGESSQFSLLA